MSLKYHHNFTLPAGILFLLLIAGGIHSQNLVKGPYILYPGVNTRMQILWQTDGGGTDTVMWGTDPTCSQGKIGSPKCTIDHLHKYTIKGLVPGTKYYYQVVIGGNAFTGTFRTAPPEGQESLKFYALGDIRTDAVAHNRVATQVNEAWLQDPESQTFVLSVGDLVTDGDQENYWKSEFFSLLFPSMREMHANMPFLSARGNHESSAKLFAKYFPYPFAGKYYWSFDYGPAHFTVIDQFTYYYPGSEQYEWIRSDLAGNDKPWKFVCLHEPGWSAGGGHENNVDVQHFIEPLCEQYNVAILFAGHNHYYARSTVTGSNGLVLQHITTGGGGAPLHTPDPSMQNVVAVSRNYQFCKITIVNDSLLQFEAISEEGEVLDQFTIER